MENKKNNLKDILGISMEKIREIVDVDTIIGEPLRLDDTTTVVPISKVSFGFAAGGSDIPTKTPKELFGGGSGVGVSIQPVAFLVSKGDDVKLLQLAKNDDPQSNLINAGVEVFDKIMGLFNKKDDAE
ncbi:MAG: sporulation protein YtfJ [Ruminococcus sp.]|jgi:sporulation protein YtfJ|nr:sporulation protein YtfJ [Ruminococcus sp.]